ncbi:MAG: ribosome recycling factor [Pseudomonadales bacterium]|nr:ribosome recycling factor [Pseudomonadales bacterium]MCP5358087.1 ribosome recycling factor [Pseudomonadales bacterium]
MIEDFIKDAEQRMAKSIVALEAAFNKIRTGRAHPSLLDTVMVSYYGADTPLNQLANITVEDARCLVVVPWEKPLIGEVEKAIMKSDLGLNPSNNGETIRVPMPALTEETRREYTRQAKAEAENARVAIRNIRRDANGSIKDLLKEKEISEDDQRRAEERIQKLTDKFIASVDAHYSAKETDLLSI